MSSPGQKLYNARYFKHPTSDIAGVTHVSIAPSTVHKTNQGAAGATGQVGALVTAMGVSVTVYGKDFAALQALIGATAANGVIGITGEAGALEKITVKDLYFVEPVDGVEIPDKDAGGKLTPSGVRGIAFGETADTFATMILAEAEV